jgi:hypothetical protein
MLPACVDALDRSELVIQDMDDALHATRAVFPHSFVSLACGTVLAPHRALHALSAKARTRRAAHIVTSVVCPYERGTALGFAWDRLHCALLLCGAVRRLRKALVWLDVPAAWDCVQVRKLFD